MGNKKAPKVKNGVPPAIDKLLKPAVGIALAMLAYHFITGINSEIPRVDVNDELALRQVFFGEGSSSGQSYAVLCQSEESTIPISSVFQDAYNEAGSTAEFRVLDCNYVLPDSEKSIAERFKIDVKIRPTIFVSGTVHEPKQVAAKHLKTGSMLTKLLRGKLEVRAAKIETTQDLRTRCLDKEMCGLLLKGTKKAPAYLKDAMSKLLVEFPKVSFAAIDASVLYAKNLEEHLPELKDGQPRFVVFKKMSGSLESGGSRLITSIAPLPTNGVSYGTMSNLVAGVVSGTETMTKIASLPKIMTRSKKLENEEQAKRQRKQGQQKRKDGGDNGDATPGGSFSDNDGSKEGRRAERERRRNEHRQANNVRERTPEEIAEMERKRRSRMEEEAKRWNMAPEDMPDEGTPFMEEDDFEDDFYDEESGTVVEDFDEDDGEDVMDLD